MAKKFLLVCLFGAALLIALGLALTRLRQEKAQTEYPPPRYPAILFREPTEEQLERLARKVARQTMGGLSGTTLGLVKPGQKIVIMTEENQDMRILRAVLNALKERSIQADYIYDYQLVQETLGLSKEAAQKAGVLPVGLYGEGVQDGYREAFRWPSFLPPELRQAALKELELDGSMQEGTNLLRKAMRIYVEENHPEYDAIFGGPTRQVFNEQIIGPKWKSRWFYTTWGDLRKVAPTFPDDLWRLAEDKVMEVVPWIESVRITDPEGTDLSFSMSAEEAEVWAKSAYLANHLYMYPLQGTRDLYFREGLKRLIVPNTNGLLAGTINHSGYHPVIKFHIQNGMVQQVEGGGRYGDLWRVLLQNEKLKKVHYPFHPRPGFFYLYEGSLGINPKYLPEPGGRAQGRAGIFHWGFGVEATLPEVNDFALKEGVPRDHGLHVQTYFTTYEIKLRGAERRLRLAERGHLTALDDPEVRALASKYGKAEDILREDWVRAIPGINAPGNYAEYARDTLSYAKREFEELKNGKSKYLAQ